MKYILIFLITVLVISQTNCYVNIVPLVQPVVNEGDRCEGYSVNPARCGDGLFCSYENMHLVGGNF